MKNHKYIKLLFIAFISLFISLEVNAQTADAILAKASAKVKSAKGLDISYSAASNGRAVSGVLKSSGSKFYVKTGGMETWYNGKALYTYNPSTKETTVVTPTVAELSEINPLLFLNSYSTYFTPSFSGNKQNGKYIIDLNSKSRKAPAKKITVFLNSKTLYPEKFIITSLDGSRTNMSITKTNYAASIAASAFEYPKSKYPNVSVVDLR